jgi:hypothetical protein
VAAEYDPALQALAGAVPRAGRLANLRAPHGPVKPGGRPSRTFLRGRPGAARDEAALCCSISGLADCASSASHGGGDRP